MGTEVCLARSRAVEQECDRYEDTAAYDEREHV